LSAVLYSFRLMIYDRLSGLNYYYKFWMYVILDAKIIVKLNLVYSNIFMCFFLNFKQLTKIHWITSNA